MSTNQPRRPAGTPAGGQWAPVAHAEPDFELQGRTLHRSTVMEEPRSVMIKMLDGTRMWFVRGHLHRTDGPAVEMPDGTCEWWVRGKEVPPPAATVPPSQPADVQAGLEQDSDTPPPVVNLPPGRFLLADPVEPARFQQQLA